MSKFSSFIFKDYDFLINQKKLVLTYAIDEVYTFQETYGFDFDFVENIDNSLLDKAIQTLFFIAGVSYYKTFLPEQIVVQKGTINQQGADFYSNTYQKGLGEFFFVNKLDPLTPIDFPVSTTKAEPTTIKTDNNGLLIGVGGGKDSLVSIELLRNQPRVATWSLDHRDQLQPLVDSISLNHMWVERTWDPQLLELKENPEAYNGHIPISAIFAAVGTIVGILSGYTSQVVSNENSANEPTLTYQNVAINHQYSKSLEFEKDYQTHLHQTQGSDSSYFSFLRPLSELSIAKLFSKVAFDKYKHLFSSCNRAYIHGQTHMSWCGECAKCAFTFLILTPFVKRVELETLWGKNLLLEPSLESIYRQLLGIEGDKPLDCVGEVKESRAAMKMAQDLYPELSKYKFELPDDYDYRAQALHSMPNDYFEILKQYLN